MEETTVIETAAEQKKTRAGKDTSKTKGSAGKKGSASGKRNDKENGSEKDKKKVSQKWVNELRYGQAVSLSFFRSNVWTLSVFIVAMLALMGLRYKTKTRMVEIKQLTVELQRAESYKLQEKALYMSLIRESELQQMMAEKGLDLKFREQPPYELSRAE